MKVFYVYIIASKSGVLYTGITSDLFRRTYEHKNGLIEGFTKKYRCKRLVYFEETSDVERAIAREKEIKDWNQKKKIELIERINPEWKDLSEGWYEDDNADAV